MRRSLRPVAIVLASLQCLAGDEARTETWQVDPGFAPPNVSIDAPTLYVLRDSRGGLVWTWNPGGGTSGADHQTSSAIIRTFEDGHTDPDFNVNPRVRTSLAIAAELGGTVLAAVALAGDFATNGAPNYRVVRLLADGSVDPSYQSPVLTNLARFMSVDSKGRLLIADPAGSVSQPILGNGGIPGTVRLQPNGSVDDTFHSPGMPVPMRGSSTGTWAPPVFDQQDRIYLAGQFAGVEGHPAKNVVRLLEDGRVDTSFLPRGFAYGSGSLSLIRAVLVQPDGKVLIAGRAFRLEGDAGTYSLIRLMPDGLVDSTFTPSREPRFFFATLDPMGRIVGAAVRASGFPSVVRYLADGREDPEFQPPTGTSPATIYSLALGFQGDVFVPPSPEQARFEGTRPGYASKIEPTGKVDTQWKAPRIQDWGIIRGAQADADGGAWKWGRFQSAAGRECSSIVHFDRQGGAANPVSNAWLPPHAIDVVAASRPGGGFYAIAGATPTTPHYTKPILQRVEADGSLDPGFVAPTNLFTEGDLPSNYRLAVVGDDVLVTRNQTQDVIDGEPWMRKLDRTGRLQPEFKGLQSPIGRADFEGIEIQAVWVGWFSVLGTYPDGRLLVTWSGDDADVNLHRIARLSVAGEIENVFEISARTPELYLTNYPMVTNPRSGNSQEQVLSLDSLPPPCPPFAGALPTADGGCLVFGSFQRLDDKTVGGLARLRADGRLDATFGTVGGGVRFQASPNELPRVDSVVVDEQGRLWVAGRFDSLNGMPAPGIARLLPDGTFDGTLAIPIEYRDLGADFANGLAWSADGSLWVLGPFALPDDPRPHLVHRLIVSEDPMRFLPGSNWVDGHFSARVRIPSGITASFEFSTDLDSWKALRTLVGSGIEEAVADAGSPGAALRFYRLRKLP